MDPNTHANVLLSDGNASWVLIELAISAVHDTSENFILLNNCASRTVAIAITYGNMPSISEVIKSHRPTLEAYEPICNPHYLLYNAII
jgi:hypothetical protein